MATGYLFPSLTALDWTLSVGNKPLVGHSALHRDRVRVDGALRRTARRSWDFMITSRMPGGAHDHLARRVSRPVRNLREEGLTHGNSPQLRRAVLVASVAVAALVFLAEKLLEPGAGGALTMATAVFLGLAEGAIVLMAGAEISDGHWHRQLLPCVGVAASTSSRRCMLLFLVQHSAACRCIRGRSIRACGSTSPYSSRAISG